MHNRADKFLWAAALLLAGAAAWPLLAEAGLLNTRGGGDSPFLLQRVHQLITAVSDGHFPVRWMPDANFGYGYPFYNYYAPLAFYVAGAFYALGFGLLRAIQLSQLTAFLVAGGGMFALGKRWFGSGWVALFVSAAYTLAPFHLVNVYVRGDSLAEFWAMAFYPLIFLAIEKINTAVSTPKLSTLWAGVPLALAYAGLVLSHNISALIFSPFVLAYALLRWATTRRVSSEKATSSFSLLTSHFPPLIPFITAGLLGLALSAWFWMPALGEQGLTQVNNTTADYFRYENHFRTAVSLVQPSFLFDFGVDQLQAFRLGLVQAIFIMVGTIAALGHFFKPFTKISRSNTLFLLTSLLLTLLMITPLSQPLWANVPLLPFVQFPWRFLGLVAFFGAGVMGFGLAGLEQWFTRATIADNEKQIALGVTTAVLITLLAVTSFGQLRPDYLYLTEADITAERLALYEWFTGNIGTTISAEYLPPAANPRAYSSQWTQQGDRWAAWVPEGTAVVTSPLIARTGHQVWEIEVTSDTAVVVLPLLYWPGWQAQLGAGRQVELTAVDGSGLTQFSLPQGRHHVTLDLGRTAVRRLAENISLVALLIVLSLAVWASPWASPWASRTANTVSSPKPRPTRQATAVWVWPLVAFLLALLLFLLPLNSRRAFPTGTLNMDFAQMGYLHHQPQGIPYENGAHLARYELTQNRAVAGETVAVTLEWSAVPPGAPLEAEVALTHAATHFYNHVPPLTAVGQPLSTGQVVYHLPIPENAPPGLYFPQINLSDKSQPQTASEARRAPLALAPLRITAVSQPAPEGLGLAVRVDEVLHRPTTPWVMDVHLGWHTAVDIPQHLQLSLRLTDLQGAPFHAAQFDIQPGYGLQPSPSWTPGQWHNDWLGLSIPPLEERPFPAPYVLLATLYDPASGQIMLTRRLGELHPTAVDARLLTFQPHQPSFTLPTDITPLTATFTRDLSDAPTINMRGYQLAQNSDQLQLTLFWEAGQDGTADYHRFVHLLDPATGQPVAQHDAMPRNNSYPTSQWVAGEIVADGLVLDISHLSAGEYWLTTGLYQIISPDDYPRLPAFQPDGTPWADGAVQLRTIQVGE